MRSARLPGVIEPVAPAHPQRVRALEVGASRWVSANSSCACAFTIPCVTFMIANMSALPVSSVVSTDSPTLMPAARSSAVRGSP